MQIVIATRYRLLYEGVSHLLKQSEEIKLADFASNEKELFARINASPPDVVLLEPLLSNTSSVSLVLRIREANHRIGIVVFSNESDPSDSIRLLRAGAKGYIEKRSTPEEMISAIINVGSGGTYLNEKLTQQLMLDPTRQSPDLTAREAEILRLLARGMSVSRIAEFLGISVKTVSTYKSRIFLRMGFSSTSDLIRYAITHELMPVEYSQAEEKVA